MTNESAEKATNDGSAAERDDVIRRRLTIGLWLSPVVAAVLIVGGVWKARIDQASGTAPAPTIGNTDADRTARTAVKREQKRLLDRAVKGMRINASAADDYCVQSRSDKFDYSVQCRSIRGVLVTFDNTSTSVRALHDRLVTIGCGTNGGTDLIGSGLPFNPHRGSLERWDPDDYIEYDCAPDPYEDRDNAIGGTTQIMSARDLAGELTEEFVSSRDSNKDRDKAGEHGSDPFTEVEIERADAEARATGKPEPVIVVIHRVYVYR